MRRNLSGIFVRYKNYEGRWTNICFEELSEEEQDEYLKEKSVEWIKSLAKGLARTIKVLGGELDLEKRYDD